MPDTTEFITRMMNREGDELDKLLSYADEIKKGSTVKKQNADSILDEIFKTQKIPVSPKKYKEIPSVPVSETGEKNFHRLLNSYEAQDYITYGSICEFNKKDVVPLITDEAEHVKPSAPESDPPELIAEKTEEKDTSGSIPKINASDLFESSEDNMSNAERFVSQQETKHPRLYFLLGFFIFMVMLLGLVSFIFIGVDTIKKFIV
ncbi:MAG: hypothetical protein PUE12_03445 [Oscillospiraceae bacterium]|nr:hypothetical protein [Oscillospiraceae bacterium]